MDYLHHVRTRREFRISADADSDDKKTDSQRHSCKCFVFYSQSQMLMLTMHKGNMSVTVHTCVVGAGITQLVVCGLAILRDASS